MPSTESTATRLPRVSLAIFLSMAFRPLYLAGALWAAISVLIWVFAPTLPSGMLQGLAWHAHEMLWGFIAAIAVGFLLTASATWTGINPLSGLALAFACVLWVVARVGFLMTHPIAFVVASACQFTFLLISAGALARVVLRAKSQRNYVLPMLVLALGATDALFLWAIWHDDAGVALERFDSGLLCMAVIALLVARRVIPFFAMRAVPELKIPMHESSAKVQLATGALAVGFALAGWRLPLAVALGAIAALCAVQLFSWKPWAVRRTPLLWILYLGYAGIGAGVVVKSLHALGLIQNAAVHVHVIALGGLSVLVIGMITRTALGHLSRPLAVDTGMVASFFLLIAAFLLRLVAVIPSSLSWIFIQLSAGAWVTAFVLYAVRFWPMMIRPNAKATDRT